MATVTHSLKSKTETTIDINWSSDSKIEGVWYTLDNGANWVYTANPMTKSGSYKITGLEVGIKYTIKTRVQTSVGQIWVISSAISVETYSGPHGGGINFEIGNKIRLGFYNPLNRKMNVSLVLDDNTELVLSDGIFIDSTSEGIQTWEYDTAKYKNDLYKSIPNTKTGKYSVKVLTPDLANDVWPGAASSKSYTYSIYEAECKPDFNDFHFNDITYGDVTGNDQLLIKKYSSVRVTVPTENAMVTKNHATPDRYEVSVDAEYREIPATQTGSGEVVVGNLTPAGKFQIAVTAYDSRGLYTTVSKEATVLEYQAPQVLIELNRKNKFENETTLSVSGTYTPLEIDGINKNTISMCEFNHTLADNGSDWAGWTAFTNITLSNGRFTCEDVILDLDNTKSYLVRVRIRDLVAPNIVDETVNEGIATFFISSNKKKAYVLGEEVVTVPALESVLNRERTNGQQLIYYTQLSQGADLNYVVETGTYRSIQASHTATMKNTPNGLNGGFTMHVYSWTASSTNGEYRRQELIYAQQTYVRHTLDSGATWSSWKRVAYVDDMLSTFFPLYSVYCHSKNENPSSRLGGYWYLSDKGFRTYTTDGNLEDPSYYFTPASNVTCDSCYVNRNHSTVRIRLELTIDAAMSDTGMDLGTLKWSEVGITSLPMGYIGQTSYSDGANGGIVYSVDWNTGKITQTDVFDIATIPSGNKFYLDMTFVVPYERMLDSACDKFYFTREVDPN